MIIVTGATGQLGSQTVTALLERVPADQIGVSVRDPERAAALGARGVRVRAGDFHDPDSLEDAFAGATQVLVISASETGRTAIEANTAAMDAARAAGAERVLYTSHQGVADDSLFGPMAVHAAGERHLAQAGGACTSLRNGFYASTVAFLIGQALTSGEIVAPADGPVSWTAHADLAEAAAVILAEPGRLGGATPPLTGPEALDLDDVARILTGLTGRTIRRTVADDEEWTAALAAHGVPEPQAAMVLGMFHASRRGEFNVVSPVLGEVLGRPATPLSSFLAGMID